jgi:hypothetical protein
MNYDSLVQSYENLNDFSEDYELQKKLNKLSYSLKRDIDKHKYCHIIRNYFGSYKNRLDNINMINGVNPNKKNIFIVSKEDENPEKRIVKLFLENRIVKDWGDIFIRDELESNIYYLKKYYSGEFLL